MQGGNIIEGIEGLDPEKKNGGRDYGFKRRGGKGKSISLTEEGSTGTRGITEINVRSGRKGRERAIGSLARVLFLGCRKERCLGEDTPINFYEREGP